MHFTHMPSAALALYISSLFADAAPIPALDAAISALKGTPRTLAETQGGS
jgi:hypothetical protein